MTKYSVRDRMAALHVDAALQPAVKYVHKRCNKTIITVFIDADAHSTKIVVMGTPLGELGEAWESRCAHRKCTSSPTQRITREQIERDVRLWLGGTIKRGEPIVRKLT